MNYSNIVNARNMYDVSKNLLGQNQILFLILDCKITMYLFLNCERNICQLIPVCYCEVAAAVDLFEISVEAKESIAWFKYIGTKNALIDLICQRSRGLRVRIQLRSDYIES